MHAMSRETTPAPQLVPTEANSFKEQLAEALNAGGCTSIAYAVVDAWVQAEARPRQISADTLQGVIEDVTAAIKLLRYKQHTVASTCDIIAASIRNRIQRAA